MPSVPDILRLVSFVADVAHIAKPDHTKSGLASHLDVTKVYHHVGGGQKRIAKLIDQ